MIFEKARVPRLSRGLFVIGAFHANMIHMQEREQNKNNDKEAESKLIEALRGALGKISEAEQLLDAAQKEGVFGDHHPNLNVGISLLHEADKRLKTEADAIEKENG